MSKSWVSCAWCERRFQKGNGEIKRAERLGREHFCSLSHAAKAGNVPRKSKAVTKICPGCGVTFESTTHNKAATYHSPSCASKNSMTPKRRAAQRKAGNAHAENLDTAKGLRSREAWKYEGVRKALETAGREFQFEFRIGDRIFDLALLDTQVLVEFDGPHHAGAQQAREDRLKDALAGEHGFTVVRVLTEPGTVIDVDVAGL